MLSPHSPIENTPGRTFGVQKFRKTWMQWSILFFLIASVFGLLMRYFFIGEVPVFQYKHILHAHSHVALLGWGYLLISGALVFTFVKDPLNRKIYKRLLWFTVIAVLGMTFSFPFQGYGLYSIAFSTMHLILGYVFAVHFLRDLKKKRENAAIRLIRFSIYWLVLSSLGLWAIGPIGAILGKVHPLYFLSVQWFLHFQLNGWFVYALLGLLITYFQGKGKTILFRKNREWVLHLSLLLTFSLSVSWSYPLKSMIYLNGLGVILQAFAYLAILKPAIAFPKPRSKNWIQLVIKIGIISLILKALMQVALVVPEAAYISYTIRPFVIGFIHLVMLGAVSFTLGGVMLEKGWLCSNPLSQWGWKFLVIAFLGTEILLFFQGTLLWMKLGFIPHYHLLLFLTSTLFPLGLFSIFWDNQKKSFKTEMNNKTVNQTKIIKMGIIKNNEIMKHTLLGAIGMAFLLLAGCGGGGGDEQGSYTPPSESAQKEVKADPKGIGEVRNVELDDSIDDAMANKGKSIVDMKCTACHQLNDKRVVGPGFQGVTNRRRPEWIMNMITNVEVMLDEDPVAQELLEECLTRMPNQNISIGDARDILEFLRKNDEERTGSRDAALN